MSKPINPGDESQGTLPTPEHGIAVSDFQNTAHEEEWRPPLPPRPSNLQLLAEQTFTPPGSLQRPKKSTRPSLISKATTAISRTDIHSQSYQDGSRETYATSTDTTPSKGSPRNYGSLRRFKAHNGSEGDDSGSVRSYVPTLEATGDVESLLGEVLSAGQESPAWKLQSGQQELDNPYDSIGFEDDGITAEFRHEFDDIGELDLTGNNEGMRQHTTNHPAEARLLIFASRGTFEPLEIQTKALPDTIFRRETDLQSPW